MQKNFSDSVVTIFVVAIIFAIMFALNHLMPLHRDDYDYSLIWGTTAHINSPWDVFHSTWLHYLQHGGRAFTVMCLNFFLWLGKFPFDLANALMFTALVILICIHARRDLKFWREPGIVAVAGILAWLSFPHFGEVAVWKSGSTVYLWSAVPVAIFLLPYNLFLKNDATVQVKKFSAIYPLLMFVLGIIAGCSVENLAVTATLLTIGITIHSARKNNFQAWLAAGALGNFVGLVILLVAPGNYVRYDDQGAGKGILAHIGNQFAGNGEMILYLLPVILLLICAWRVLKFFSAGKKISAMPMKISRGEIILSAIILLFIFSYFDESFIALTICDFVKENIFPLVHAKQKTIDHFDNLMMKSEEMIIYWAIIFLIYSPLKKSLGVVGKKISAQKIFLKFPQIRYSLFLFALAIFNNFVMIAAPTFPVRATFSSVVMILIGALAIIRLAPVHESFSSGMTGGILKIGALIICGFTIISALVITHDLRWENDLRIDAVKRASAEKISVVEMKPIELKNRALRHVFFVDFDNGVTKTGLCKYYGIKDIVIKK